jgi:hypothetical protein
MVNKADFISQDLVIHLMSNTKTECEAHFTHQSVSEVEIKIYKNNIKIYESNEHIYESKVHPSYLYMFRINPVVNIME